MNRKKFYIGLTVILINVILSGCNTKDDAVLITEPEETVYIDTKVPEYESIYVYVSGEVESPGVYCVKKDARVYQVIDKAGGMTKKAQKGNINLAETVCDGQQICILSKRQYKKSLSVTETETAMLKKDGQNRININNATAQQLTGLPGIGESKAAAIVAYREENGEFSTIEDIKNVSGIGESTFKNIESMITVN